MTGTIRIQLEIGPKGKRVIAVAPDWPGLSRGAKSEDGAVETLRAYLPRYTRIAELAGLAGDYPADGGVEVVERYPGVSSTDFWGISFAFSAIDRQPMTDAELERSLALLRGAWSFFDEVRARVSPEMARGPRGAARTRDQIARHTIYSEFAMSKKVGHPGDMEALANDDALRRHREGYVAAIAAYHSEGKMARKWPLRYLIRHTAYHSLDHAWEMEDKDLTGMCGRSPGSPATT